MINSCLFGDCRDGLRQIKAAGVRPQTVVTSPPYYGLRDYGHPGQLGLERTPDEYIAAMVEVFRAVRDVLADDGTLWLNIGDSYGSGEIGRHDSVQGREIDGKVVTRKSKARQQARLSTGVKPKDLIGIPWMLAFALRADGWYLRQDIIWHKPNPMPESVRDRCTKAHEYLFLLSKSERYYFDSEAMQERSTGAVPGNVNHKYTEAYEQGDKRQRTKAGLLAYSFKRKTATTPPPGQPTQHREDRDDTVYIGKRNRRSVWTIATTPYSGAHFATFPPALIEPCIMAGSRPGDVVLDPFLGSGTTARVSMALGRQWIGCEINPEYKALQDGRTERVQIRIDGVKIED